MHTALLTDLYQLTMGQAYFELGMHDIAVFELFVRRLPRQRRFLIAAGLTQVVEYLEQLKLTSEELDYLSHLGTFRPAFLEHLSRLRFTGSVHAMPEGTPFFADEPLLRITAPILEAQLVESRIINIVHLQTLIASKAARCVIAARGRKLIDFGMRRAHGSDAALYAARAAYLAGFHATATVEAGRRFGIPVAGTMAHSFIEAHDREGDAFRNFLASYPGEATLLVDTYDTRRGTERVGVLARELADSGAAARIGAIRIDSGNLVEDVRDARAILDRHRCQDIRIVVSGGLDEQAVDELVRAEVPADSFGIGTSLVVSSDAPALDMAYKLQDYAGKSRRKRSPGKMTWPGTKQVFRECDARGRMLRDQVGLADEALPGRRLLETVVEAGRRVAMPVTLEESRERCVREISALPEILRELGESRAGEEFPVLISERLRALTAAVDAEAV